MANIQDVAKRAGVSISTVSRVLNGTAFVNEEIRLRVEAVMHELQYSPHPGARSLRVNRSRVIGLLISDIQNPFFMALIQGIEDVAQENGYSLILCNSDENPRKEKHYFEVLCAERVAGAIIVPTRERLGNALNDFHKRAIPVVAVDRRIQDETVDAVLVDNKRGSCEAVSHLIANGYRRIGIVTGPLVTTTGRERLEGYRQAFLSAGLPHDSSLERTGPFKEESGQRLTNELLDLTPPIDALFVGNNVLTLGAFNAILARHLRVPDDIALIGYDETPWAALSSVSLTTVTQPIYELGSAAAHRLLQRLKDPGGQTRQEILLTPTLNIRNSSYHRDKLIDTIPS